MHLFYDHLIDIVPVRRQLETYLQPAEVEEILLVLDGAHHHAVMESVLRIIPLHEHEVFLEAFATDPSAASLLEYLARHDPDIEVRIRQAVDESNKKFLDGIHE